VSETRLEEERADDEIEARVFALFDELPPETPSAA